MKKLILYILVLSITVYISGCTGNSNKGSAFDDPSIEDEELITAEELIEFYEVDDSTVPEKYIDIYIDHFNLTRGKVKKYTNWNYYDHIKEDYDAGIEYDYSPDTKLNIKTYLTDVDPQEFMKVSQYFFIEFDHRLKETNSTVLEIMCVDFEHMKIYFAGDYLNYDTDSDIMRAELKEEDKDEIRAGFLEHVNFNPPFDRMINIDNYSFTLWIVSDERECVQLKGTDLDAIGFPGFDDYWKDLYKKYFETEYSLSYEITE